MLVRLAAIAASVFALACTTSCTTHDVPVGGGARAVLDQRPAPIKALDVLFVVDNSGSMRDKQAEVIAAARTSLFAELAADLGELPDLHLGVISDDVGTGPYFWNGCTQPQNGALLTGAGDGACPQVQGRFLLDVGNPDGTRTTNYTGAIDEAFTCLASVGVDGCGFERPFDAVHMALDGSRPENAGFLRDDAMLLVVFLTDEDDCSASDALFDPASPQLGFTDYRCFRELVECDGDDPDVAGDKTGCASREDGTYTHPVADAVAFLRGLKRDPSQVMVAGMYGPATPVAVGPSPGNPQALHVLPSCVTTWGGATPAIRLGALVDQFSSRYAFSSICEGGSAQQLAHITRTAGGILAAEPCLLGDVPVAAAGCRVYTRGAAPASRVELRRCTGGTDEDCVAIERDDVTCGYTDTHLAAHARGDANTARAGQDLIVECATPGSAP